MQLSFLAIFARDLNVGQLGLDRADSIRDIVDGELNAVFVIRGSKVTGRRGLHSILVVSEAV